MAGIRDIFRRKKQQQTEAVQMPNPAMPEAIQMEVPKVEATPISEGATAVEKSIKGVTTPSPVVEVPTLQPAPTTSYVDTYERLNAHNAPKSAEEKATEEKRASSRKTLAQIGDVISGIANVYAASQGATAAQLPSMAKSVQDRYNKAIADRKAAEDRYAAGWLQAYSADEASRLKKAQEELARKKAEREAEEKLRDYNLQVAKHIAEVEKNAKAAEYNEKKLAESVRANKANEATKAKNAEAYAKYMGEKAKNITAHKDDEPFMLDNGTTIYIPKKVYANKIGELYNEVVNGMTPAERTQAGIYPSSPPTKAQQEMVVKMYWRNNPSVVAQMKAMARGAEEDEDEYANYLIMNNQPNSNEDIDII